MYELEIEFDTANIFITALPQPNQCMNPGELVFLGYLGKLAIMLHSLSSCEQMFIPCELLT
jgi:hypothetical protein